MLIDIHPHVISTNTERYPLAPLGGHQSDWSAERPIEYEDMIDEMDEAGIDKSVLVQASTAYAFDNSYVADSVAEYPDRFTGVFSVDVLAPDVAEKMKYWMGRGLTGMRIFTSGSTQPEQATFFAHPKAYPAWQAASDLGIPVCMQMRVKGFELLKSVLNKFPEVPVVLDHFGRTDASDGPPYEAAKPLFELARYPNVYLKLTHRPIESSMQGTSTPEAFFTRVIEEFGVDRIAWGSNFPSAHQPLAELVALAREALSFLPQKDQDWIFYKTALKLYPALAKN
jgi:L-fuconolactonase